MIKHLATREDFDELAQGTPIKYPYLYLTNRATGYGLFDGIYRRPQGLTVVLIDPILIGINNHINYTSGSISVPLFTWSGYAPSCVIGTPVEIVSISKFNFWRNLATK